MTVTLTSAGHHHDEEGRKLCDCKAIAASERAAARRSKPAGYTWPLYNQPRKPNQLPQAHVNRTSHPLMWVQNALQPAYKRERLYGIYGSFTTAERHYAAYCQWQEEQRT